MAKDTAEQVLDFARQVAAGARSWIDLHNAIYGIGGKFPELFMTKADRAAFSKSPEHDKIQQLITELRERCGDPAPIARLSANANGVVSVRMPRSVHAALPAEAEDEGISLNSLCASKAVL